MSLPPEMLDDVLARLPFERLVRTGRLSPAWRRRWESVPFLDIWFSRGITAVRDPRFLRWPCAEPGRTFSARTLWRCAAPVRSFTARIQKRHFYRAGRWLPALARKRVQVLSLRFDKPWSAHSPGPHVVGPALYSCRDLFVLELSGYCRLLRAPQGFAGFTKLGTLNLDHVVLPFRGAAAQLELVISSAPHLAGLTLNEVVLGDGGADVETCAIRAPNLRILKLIMYVDNGCRIPEELPLLAVAIISIDPLFGTPDFIDTLRRVSDVEMLFFNTDSEQTMKNPLQRILPKFQNLRFAQQTANFGKFSSIMSIFSLLRFAPHIKKLKIKVVRPDAEPKEIGNLENDDVIDHGILDAVIYDEMFVNLKHISVDGTEYLPNDMWFMKFLLSKTRLLEYFFVTFKHEEETKSYVEACKELATCKKVLPQAMLIPRPRGKPTPSLWED